MIKTDVVERFSSGSKTDFGIIYNHYFKTIKTNISKFILNTDFADDILQEVFLKLWENRVRFRDNQEISAWLFRVSYNTAITHVRDMLKDRKYFLSEMPASINELPAYEEPRKITPFKESLLPEAIKLLPERKRQVVDLCKFQGKSYAEAGSILGIKKDTVKEYLVASLKFIKRYILSKDAS